MDEAVLGERSRGPGWREGESLAEIVRQGDAGDVRGRDWPACLIGESNGNGNGDLEPCLLDVGAQREAIQPPAEPHRDASRMPQRGQDLDAVCAGYRRDSHEPVRVGRVGTAIKDHPHVLDHRDGLNNKGGGVPGGRLSRRSGDCGLRRAVPEGERPGNRGADCQHPDEGPRRHVGSPADRTTVGRPRDRSAAKRIRPRDAMTPRPYRPYSCASRTVLEDPAVARCRGMIAGGRGPFRKLNAPMMLPAAASSRVSGRSRQFCSMNFNMDVKSSAVWSMKCRRAYGLTRSAGTRKPSPLVSRCGGRTWSYQPPQSSYATRKAELFHDLLAMSELTSPRTNRWPVARLPGGCSLAPDGVK